MLEREIAALSHFIEPIVKIQYFGELPSGIATPSAYFPVPELQGNEHSLNSYENSFSLYIKIFHKDSMKSYTIASEIVKQVQYSKKEIPLYDKDGKITDKNFLVKSITAKNIDVGVTQLTITWNTHTSYIKPEVVKAGDLYFDGLATSTVKEEKDG